MSSFQASALNDRWPFFGALHSRAAEKEGEAESQCAHPDKAMGVTAETIVAVLASTGKGPTAQKAIDRAVANILWARGEMEVTVP